MWHDIQETHTHSARAGEREREGGRAAERLVAHEHISSLKRLYSTRLSPSASVLCVRIPEM